MSKLAPTSTKYIIKAKIKAKGVIEKPDVIGAIFGQTEGLLGSELDLRELQRSGRIGRIEVNIKSSGGNSEGEIIIPSSLDASETALVAATLETIDRIGPCTAEILLGSVEDTRSMKRKYVVDKAKDILKGLIDSGIPNTDEISEEIKEAVRTSEIGNYKGFPAGPAVENADNIIVVEGRADVINLLKYGIKNTIAIEGTSISSDIQKLTKEKTVTVFVDGDRGGKLIVRELMQKAEVDYIACAPEGKEVEELTKKEVYKALRDKITAEQFRIEMKDVKTSVRITPKKDEKPEPRRIRHSRDSIDTRRSSPGRGTQRTGRYDRKGFGGRRESSRPPRKEILKPAQKELFKKTLEELVGSHAACIYDENNELLGKVPVSELVNTLQTVENPYAVVFDGKVNYELNSVAKRKGIKFLVGMEKEKIEFTSVNILERKDL